MEPEPADLLPGTVQTAIDRVVASCEALGLLGEDIEDEWQYVQDLGEAWLSRLEETAAARGNEAVTAEVGAAIDRACAEAALITDPHRAIDWLSTLPQVVSSSPPANAQRTSPATTEVPDAAPDARGHQFTRGSRRTHSSRAPLPSLPTRRNRAERDPRAGLP